MGIQNLLPLLENSTRACHVSEFRGHTVAVDSYCWLHKGARGCALELARGAPTDSYVNYCMKYVQMLLSYDIKPIMVFDGRHLPAKLKTEEKRRESKKQARKQGHELLLLGKSSEAYKFFQQCIDVDPKMALNLIKECRKIGVDCIVAPYESDAQLAFFSLKGIADVIISEDSDLLLFGCKKVLYKMDSNGVGQLVEAEKLNLSIKMREDHYTFDKFRYMCILSGCDYIDSLPGIGLKKALKFLITTAETDPELFLGKVPRYLNMRHLVVTNEYKENFMIADATFKHQTVFDPFQKKLIPLTPVCDKYKPYCKNAGDLFDNDQAYQLALGNLDPLTMERIDNWDPTDPKSFISNYSIWSNSFRSRPIKKKPPKKKSNTLSKSLGKTIIETSTEQQEEQIAKELEFYKSKPAEAHEDNSDESKPLSPKSQDASSPVLNHSSNPFIKKKISKFSITQVSDTVVTSRFFSKSQESQTSTDNTDSEELQEMLPLSQNSDIENQDMNISLNSDVDMPAVNCECILEVEEKDLVFQTPPQLSPSLLRKGDSKKRKLQSTSSFDFKKSAKKQLTLNEMFRRIQSM